MKKKHTIKVPVVITGYVVVYDPDETPENVESIVEICTPMMLGNQMRDVTVKMTGPVIVDEETQWCIHCEKHVLTNPPDELEPSDHVRCTECQRVIT